MKPEAIIKKLNGPVAIEGTEQYEVCSNVMGKNYLISVAKPATWLPTQERYSVVYVLDANSCFGAVVDMVRMLQVTNELPPLMVIGIGYPSCDLQEFANRRLQEFTPTADADYGKLWSPELELTSKGGDAGLFLSFLRDELKPLLEKCFPLIEEDATLIGDSLAGLFVLYALFARPKAFSRYIIGSPAIFWDNGFIHRHEEKFYQKNKRLDATVFMGVGGLEDKEPFHFPASARKAMSHVSMVNDLEKMSKHLKSRRYSGLNMQSKVFEGETHMSVIPGLINRGLRAVYEPILN